MRCLVITKKHITAVICIIFFVLLIIVLNAKLKKNRAVTAFRPAEKIISQVLPTAEEPETAREIKEFVSSAIKKEPTEILQRFSGMFKESVPEKTPEPTAVPTPLPTEIPTVTKTSVSSVSFKNDTEYEVSADSFKEEPLAFSGDVHVLIIHTHTTECYTSETPGNFPDNGRSTDDSRNMIEIGRIICSELENSGINVIHDTTVHDYPSYQGAYGRSLSTAMQYIEENKNIQIVLDIHRDAIPDSNGKRVKLVNDIDGVSFAQMMIVCGTNGSGLSHPNWSNNLNFAVKIQNNVNEKYPGLMRPINLRKERFNQHIAPGSIILEIGTHGNTLAEAKNSAAVIGKEIAEIITAEK